MRTRRLVLLVGASLVAGSLAADESPPGRYALGTVFVADGGLPVAGAEDRVSVDRWVDSDCRIHDPAGEGEPRPMAAERGGEMTLGVGILGCRRATPPEISCHWTIEPEATADTSCRPTLGSRSGESSWRGFRGSVPLTLPERTGVYRLALDCRLGAAETRLKRFETTLYIGWSTPLAPFDPPAPEWYARAACWAAGLGAEHREIDVLESIRRGLYRYGGERWRYGYAEASGDGTYRFHLDTTDSGTRTVEYRLRDDTGVRCFGPKPLCKCPWQSLVNPRDACNFGDCYTFSQILQAMAGVMGVGGLRPVVIRGEGNAGFLTIEGRSLDPEFSRGVHCPKGASCDTYVFGSHSLRQRDGVFHDATFDRGYATADGPVAWSRTLHGRDRDRDNLRFPGSARTWRRGHRGYGGWMFLDAGEPEPPWRATGAESIRFTGNVEIRAIDPDDDGLDERLVTTVEVEVLVAGTYVLEASLWRDQQPVARLPSWDVAKPAGAVVVATPGKHLVRMTFSGEEIYRSRLDGPYSLRVAADTTAGRATLIRETPAFDHLSFGERPGGLLALDTHRPSSPEVGSTERLQITAEVEARQSGIFAIEVRLAAGGATLSYAGVEEDLFIGHHSLRLDLELPATDATHRRPTDLTVILYDSRLRAIDAMVRSVD